MIQENFVVMKKKHMTSFRQPLLLEVGGGGDGGVKACGRLLRLEVTKGPRATRRGPGQRAAWNLSATATAWVRSCAFLASLARMHHPAAA